MAFGLLIAAFIYLVPWEIALYTFTAVIFIGVVIADAIDRGIHIPLFYNIIRKLERDGAFPGKGAIFFFIGVLFCLAFFGDSVTPVAIVVLAVLDSVSTIVGKRFGKIKLVGKKTLEGTASGIVASAIVLLFLVQPVAAIVVSIIAGVTELVSPVDDNLTIPVVSCICLFLLNGGLVL